MTDPQELQAMRGALRGYLAGAPRPDEVGGAPLDRDRWTRLARELGVTGIRVPAALGGIGMGLDAELLVHQELGRVLSDLPYLSTVGFAAAALAHVDSDIARQRLGEIAAGELVLACVLTTDEPVAATIDGTNAVLDGVADCVADAGDCDALLVLADDAGTDVLAWVDAADVSVEPLRSLDLTRRFARVRLAGARASVLATGDAATKAVASANANGYLALATESLGLAEQAFELTVDYVKVRHQFGRPIGGFQAVKHRCADMVVELERTRSAVAFATNALVTSADETQRSAALAVARIHSADVPFWIADETIHLHGGIGFTWEHRAHLYYRRAKSNQLWLDPHGRQRRVLAGLVSSMYSREESVS